MSFAVALKEIGMVKKLDLIAGFTQQLVLILFNIWLNTFHNALILEPVVRKVDSVIHRIAIFFKLSKLVQLLV